MTLSYGGSALPMPWRVSRAAGRPTRVVGRPLPVAAPPEPAPVSAVGLGVAAVLWLMLGCSGLLSAMVFTDDPHSMVVALAVWLIGFVAPTLTASAIAYRMESRGQAAPEAGDTP